MNIIFVILYIAILIGLFFSLLFLVKGTMKFCKGENKVIVFIAGFGLVLCLGAYLAVNQYAGHYTEQQLKERVNNGYTAYLNGQEVDINNISTKEYRYEFNDAEKKILITQKKR